MTSHFRPTYDVDGPHRRPRRGPSLAHIALWIVLVSGVLAALVDFYVR